jgi:hypothetical protein
MLMIKKLLATTTSYYFIFLLLDDNKIGVPLLAKVVGRFGFKSAPIMSFLLKKIMLFLSLDLLIVQHSF